MKIKTKFDNLIRLVIDKAKAWEFANTRKSYRQVACSLILQRIFTNEYLKNLGFLQIA
jgi:hypothetical protein